MEKHGNKLEKQLGKSWKMLKHMLKTKLNKKLKTVEKQLNNGGGSTQVARDPQRGSTQIVTNMMQSAQVARDP